jgi:hypothetical protein
VKVKGTASAAAKRNKREILRNFIQRVLLLAGLGTDFVQDRLIELAA